MPQELILIREKKLHKLLPGQSKKSDLEASGVHVIHGTTCYVVFDNLNMVARVDLSLEKHESNALFPVPNLCSGFEDITFDPATERFYLIVEAVEGRNGFFHGVVAEYERDFEFRCCTQLSPAFPQQNKGFEGVDHRWCGETEQLVGLWEDADGEQEGRGRLYCFPRAHDGTWAEPELIHLPAEARFLDYAAVSSSGQRVAIVSQESQRVWIGEWNASFTGFEEGVGAVYRFPEDSYCNVEGVAWLTDTELVMVSDRRKKKQAKSCREKDQSIHIFRIP